MINEKKLIEFIDDKIKNIRHRMYDLHEQDLHGVLTERLYLLREIRSKIQMLSYSSGWILCSERLPEEYGWYLVSCKGKKTAQMRLYDGMWDSITEVVAWMPLPETYRGEEQC